MSCELVLFVWSGVKLVGICTIPREGDTCRSKYMRIPSPFSIFHTIFLQCTFRLFAIRLHDLQSELNSEHFNQNPVRIIITVKINGRRWFRTHTSHIDRLQWHLAHVCVCNVTVCRTVNTFLTFNTFFFCWPDSDSKQTGTLRGYITNYSFYS